jgi:hypothetical protein
MRLAFQADISRVFTFMVAHAGTEGCILVGRRTSGTKANRDGLSIDIRNP